MNENRLLNGLKGEYSLFLFFFSTFYHRLHHRYSLSMSDTMFGYSDMLNQRNEPQTDALLIFALIRQGICALYISLVRHCFSGPVKDRLQISPAQFLHWTHANSCFKVMNLWMLVSALESKIEKIIATLSHNYDFFSLEISSLHLAISQNHLM